MTNTVLNRETILQHIQSKMHVSNSHIESHYKLNRLKDVGLYGSRPEEDMYIFYFSKTDNKFLTGYELSEYMDKHVHQVKHQFDTLFEGQNVSSVSINVDDKFDTLLKITIKVMDDFLSITILNLIRFVYHMPFESKSSYVNMHWKRMMNDRLIWFNTGDILQQFKGRYVPLSLTHDLDGLPFEHSLLLDLPEFQIHRDFKREIERFYGSYPNYVQRSAKISLSYGDIFSLGSNRNEIILNKWTTMRKVTTVTNMNKFTFIELNFLRTAQPKLSDTEFRKFVNWYRNNRNTVVRNYLNDESYWHSCVTDMDWSYLYTMYLYDKIILPTNNDANKEDFRNTVHDIILMTKTLRKKIEVHATGFKGLLRYHDELSYKSRLKQLRSNNIIFSVLKTERWKPVKLAVRRSKLKMDLLDTSMKLGLEGYNMNHCVGSYVWSVDKGYSCIYHLEYDDKPYTIEITYPNKVYKTKEPRIYQLRQVYGHHNSKAPDEVLEHMRNIVKEANKIAMDQRTKQKKIA